MALRNPLLGAAARIVFAKGDSHMHEHFCETWAADNQAQAHALVEVAARETDYLRAIGALPYPTAEFIIKAGPLTDDELERLRQRFNSPAEAPALSAVDRISVYRVATAAILARLVAMFEVELGGCLAARSAFYEHSLATGLGMALMELSESEFTPQQLKATKTRICALAENYMHQAEALFISMEEANATQ